MKTAKLDQAILEALRDGPKRLRELRDSLLPLDIAEGDPCVTRRLHTLRAQGLVKLHRARWARTETSWGGDECIQAGCPAPQGVCVRDPDGGYYWCRAWQASQSQMLDALAERLAGHIWEDALRALARRAQEAMGQPPGLERDEQLVAHSHLWIVLAGAIQGLAPEHDDAGHQAEEMATACNRALYPHPKAE